MSDSIRPCDVASAIANESCPPPALREAKRPTRKRETLDAATREAMGVRLRARRKALGLKLKDVARVTNVTIPAVSSWEAGRCLPSGDKLVGLAKLFGMTPEEVLGAKPATITSPICHVLTQTEGNIKHDVSAVEHGIRELLSTFESKHGVEVSEVTLAGRSESGPHVMLDFVISRELHLGDTT